MTTFAPLGSQAAAVDLSQTFSLPEASYGPPATARLGVANATTSISLITGLDLELGYKVDLAGRIAPVDADGAFDGLFLSSAASGMPYASLAGGGNFLGATTALADDLHVSVGVASLAPGVSSYAPDAYTALARLGGEPAPYNPRSAHSLLAGVSWNIGHWSELGLTATQSAERDGLLGSAAPGTTASTTALGVSARVHLGNGWVTSASYSQALSQLEQKSGPPLAYDSLYTRSYGIAIAKNGLFGDDALGLAVSRPALASDGGFAVLPGTQGGAAFFARNHLLEGAAPETDIEVGYVTTFLDGSLALQTNASFQMNYAGQYGTNAVSLLSRARIKF
ncbi:MAG TPA: hypothetical protein VNU97_00595 [Rhizomicrobium sp.]|nr:hypothetical protein [Rhizomicrobium sp.]